MSYVSSLIPLGIAVALAALQSPEANQAYEQGRQAIDRGSWQEAIKAFEEAAEDEALADSGLYWQAYAYSKIPDAKRALELVAQLESRFPKSTWRDDAQALAAEIRGGSSRGASSDDEDLKLMALNGLMQGDEEAAIPILEEFLASEKSTRLRERALFVLAQSDSEKAHAILANVARGERDPELQRQAIRYLGVHGSDRGLALLAELYRSLSSTEARSTVLESLMIADDEKRLLEVARNEVDLELRGRAIQLLGTMDATTELWEMYQRESSQDMKEKMLQAFMVAGDEEHLLQVARDRQASPELRNAAIQLLGAEGAEEELWRLFQEETSIETKERILQALFVADAAEKLAGVATDKAQPAELRKAAIHGLGVSGEEAIPALVGLYRSETDREVKEQVLEALFINDAAAQIVEIARSESDPELRRRAVEKLSLMDAEEARDFLMEILRKK
ncbi:MAG TPA: HEAT repeat domain-containing protein [Vicinamibacteria bacterium]|nr:HEAT repeat domain-containing protein [Vicinamibacteria bacterium]